MAILTGLSMPKTLSQNDLEKMLREQLEGMLNPKSKGKAQGDKVMDMSYGWIQEHYPDEDTVVFECHGKHYAAKYTATGKSAKLLPECVEVVRAGWTPKGKPMKISELKNYKG